ncbi:hypothetical protein [Cupriavidus sp. CP313]
MSKRFLFLFAFSFLLGSCGGGGDDGSSSEAASPPAQTLTVPLTTAMAALAANGITANFSISGSVENKPVSGSGTLKAGPADSATLNSAVVLKTTETVTGTIITNGNSEPFSGTRFIFRNSATFAVVAIDQGADGYAAFADYTFPATVKAGDSGPLATATIFSDNTQAAKLGSLTQSFSVAVDSGATLLVTFLDTEFDNSNARVGEEETTFRIDTSGNISFVSSKFTFFGANGQPVGTLIFQ